MAYKDGSLLLQPEVAGLFDKVSEISFELAVLLPSTKVLRLFLKQRVHHLFGLLFFSRWQPRPPFFPWASCLAWLQERARGVFLTEVPSSQRMLVCVQLT